MLLIALGFHAGLLFFPWQSLQPKKSEADQGKSVKLSRLTPLKTGQPETNQSKTLEEPIPTANQSEIVVKASPSPVPSPTAAAIAKTPKPAPTAMRRSTPPSSQPKTASKAKTAQTAATLSQPDQIFVSRLQKLENREVNEPVSSTLFPNPDDFYQDSVKELGKPGIVGIEYVSFQRPEDVYQQLIQLYPDYEIKPKPDYGNGLVYQFKKGNFVRYLNLVRAKLGAGTLVILWNREPS